MRIPARFSTIGLALLLAVPAVSYCADAQATPTPTPSPTPQYSSGNFFKDIAKDQKAIWTAPFHAKSSDLKWIIPVGGVAAGLFATDRRTSDAVPTTGNWPTVSRDISYAGSGLATAGLAGSLYLIGKATDNDKLKDTGRLAAEALIDTTIVTQVFKYSLGRERPFQGAGHGRYFKGGQSFFSGHSSSSFAVATVVACQYHDNTFIKIAAYATASAVGLSRYTGRKHFLSDIFIGAVVGYEIGHFVCKNRQLKPSDDPTAAPQKFSWKPAIQPWFDRRTGLGGQLVWYF